MSRKREISRQGRATAIALKDGAEFGRNDENFGSGKKALAIRAAIVHNKSATDAGDKSGVR